MSKYFMLGGALLASRAFADGFFAKVDIACVPDPDVRQLLFALKSGNRESQKRWLAKHGVQLGDKQRLIDALSEAVEADSEQEGVRRKLKELAAAATLMRGEQLKESVRKLFGFPEESKAVIKMPRTG